MKRLIVVLFVLSLFSAVFGEITKTREIRYIEVVRSEEICSDSTWRVIKTEHYHYAVCGQYDKTTDSSVVEIWNDTTLVFRHKF